MSRNVSHQISTLDRVAHAIDAAMAIDLDDLERLVQQAHESTEEQICDPEEAFPVSRQALRMLWRFRGQLDAVSMPRGSCHA